MRMIFGVVALLLAVAVVGFVAKAQLSSATKPHPVSADAAASGVAAAAAVPLTQQPAQIKQQVDALMQQARPMPEDTK
ncbi:MAG TPA: hypothetical protein VLJ86_12255 [Ramlibacter sp.]|nr:hypothetical protein [Ramlibacter sp.]